MLEFIKVILLGIVEGITEWLPISSTGHMILVNEFVRLQVSKSFEEVFLVVIQLGAIFAVIHLYFDRLWPFYNRREISLKKLRRQGKANVPILLTYVRKRYIKEDKFILWCKIFLSCLPAIIVGLPLDDWLEEHFYNYGVVACMLVIYGILFILVENSNKKRSPICKSLSQISWKMALGIGIFQLLSLIPGTSRSGATILGGIFLGTSRKLAAEYTFFLAIPVMFGASLLKILKYGPLFSLIEVAFLLMGMVSAFCVSVFTIKFLMGYIRRHNFKVFGYYRILLGCIVLVYFAVKTFLS